jgi:hypothetical protein
MAMLNQTIPMSILGCPAGSCRDQARERTRPNWRALATSFAAGALAVSAVVLLAGSSAAPVATSANATRDAGAAQCAAGELPREFSNELRWQKQPVRLDGMFRKKR